jgi:hypothetical protein
LVAVPPGEEALLAQAPRPAKPAHALTRLGKLGERLAPELFLGTIAAIRGDHRPASST